MKAIRNSNFSFSGQTKVYNGKVRDVYTMYQMRDQSNQYQRNIWIMIS